MTEKQGLMGKLKSAILGDKNEKILRAAYRAGRRKGEKEAGVAAKETSSSSSDDEDGAVAGHSHSSAGHSSQQYGEGNTSTEGGQGLVSGAGDGGHHAGNKEAAAITGTSAAGTAAAAAISTRANEHDHVVTSTSRGKIVTSPPRVNRKPLEPKATGDYANAKNPTEVAEGVSDKVYRDGANGKEGTGGLLANEQPHYDNNATTALGHGVFYQPRDTQGGVYGNTKEPSSKSGGIIGTATLGAIGTAALGAVAGGVGRGNSSAEYPEATNAKLAPSGLKTQSGGRPHDQTELTEATTIAGGATKGDNKEAEHSGDVSGHSKTAPHFKPSGPHLPPSSGPNEKYSGAGTAAGTTTGTHAGTTTGTHAGTTTGTAAGTTTGTAAGAAAGTAAATAAARASAANLVHAGHAPSTDQFDYDREIKRLDRNIDTTKKEIEAHGKGSTLDPKGSESTNTAGVGATTSGTGKAQSTKDTASVASLYREPIDSPKNAKGHHSTTGTSDSAITAEHAPSVQGSTSGTHEAVSSEQPGYFDTAKAAVASAGAAAAGVLGYEGYQRYHEGESTGAVTSSENVTGSKGLTHTSTGVNEATLGSGAVGAAEHNDDDSTSKATGLLSRLGFGGSNTSESSTVERNLKGEVETTAYNKKHGYNDSSTLLEVAERADPSIEKLSQHKSLKGTEELETENETRDGDGVQELPDALKQNKVSSSGGNHGSKSTSTAATAGSPRQRTPP